MQVSSPDVSDVWLQFVCTYGRLHFIPKSLNLRKNKEIKHVFYVKDSKQAQKLERKWRQIKLFV